jgi:hypothetical protein
VVFVSSLIPVFPNFGHQVKNLQSCSLIRGGQLMNQFPTMKISNDDRACLEIEPVLRTAGRVHTKMDNRSSTRFLGLRKNYSSDLNGLGFCRIEQVSQFSISSEY